MTVVPPMNGVFQNFPTPKALVRKPDLAADAEIYSLTWSPRDWRCLREEARLFVWLVGSDMGKGPGKLRLVEFDAKLSLRLPKLSLCTISSEWRWRFGAWLVFFKYGYGFRCACSDVLFFLLLFTLLWVSASLVFIVDVLVAPFWAMCLEVVRTLHSALRPPGWRSSYPPGAKTKTFCGFFSEFWIRYFWDPPQSIHFLMVNGRQYESISQPPLANRVWGLPKSLCLKRNGQTLLQYRTNASM